MNFTVRKYLTAVLFLATCLGNKCTAQQKETLAITYNHFAYTQSGQPIFVLALADSTSEFVFHFADSIGSRINDMKQKKILHHSSYLIKQQSAKYDAASYTFAQYLIKKPFDDFKYEATGFEKRILGYKCQKYVCKSGNGDLREVWSTDSIGNYFAKVYAPGAPGVVLELKFHIKVLDVDLSYQAIDLKFTDDAVVFPDTEAVLTANGLERYRKGYTRLSKVNINPKAIIPRNKNMRYPLPASN